MDPADPVVVQANPLGPTEASPLRQPRDDRRREPVVALEYVADARDQHPTGVVAAHRAAPIGSTSSGAK